MNTTTSSDAAPQAPLVSLRQQARWLPADMDTPISLYLGMVGQQDGILLESAEVDGRWGRYSVLACDMALYVRCREGRLDLRIEDARLAPLAVLQGLPFVEGLRRLMQGLYLEAPAQIEGLPAITRALYGWVGFGMASVVPLCYSLAGKSTRVPPSVAISLVSSLSFLGFLGCPPMVGFLSHQFDLRWALSPIVVVGVAIFCLAPLVRRIRA